MCKCKGTGRIIVQCSEGNGQGYELKVCDRCGGTGEEKDNKSAGKSGE